MTTKLALYVIAFFTTAVQIGGMIAENKLMDIGYLWYPIGASVFWYISNHIKSKPVIWGCRCAELLIFCALLGHFYVSLKDDSDYILNFISQNGPSWIPILALDVAYKTYIESKTTHRKNLVRYSEKLFHLMQRYACCHNTGHLDKTSVEYQLLYTEIEDCQKKLKQELLAGNKITEFNIKGFYRNMIEWWDRGRQDYNFCRWYIIKQLLVKKEIYFLFCEERKLAESIAIYHSEFMGIINSRNFIGIEFDEQIQKRIDKVKKIYHKDSCLHFFPEYKLNEL